jgi:hypothetical protein
VAAGRGVRPACDVPSSSVPHTRRRAVVPPVSPDTAPRWLSTPPPPPPAPPLAPQVSTAFDAVPYGLHVSRADRGPGGVASAFGFYSQLFSAAKQMATRSAAVSTEDAERADSTMSIGELCFLLRDFKVMPQLISRAELFFILSRRTLGRELRKRRERHDLLLSMLRREEEDLARDMRDAKMVPASAAATAAAAAAATASSLGGVGSLRGSRSPVRRVAAGGHTMPSAQDMARMDRIAARRERIGNMRLMLRKFDAAVLDPSTKVEARMEVRRLHRGAGGGGAARSIPTFLARSLGAAHALGVELHRVPGGEAWGASGGGGGCEDRQAATALAADGRSVTITILPPCGHHSSAAARSRDATLHWSALQLPPPPPCQSPRPTRT